MLDAYRHGIFPWPSNWEGQWCTGWHSPDPRALLPLDRLHISRRLIRKLKADRFRFRWNSDFPNVLDQCATIGSREGATWLSPSLMRSVNELHQLGYAKSIEVYESADDFTQICGGLYGIQIGGAFSAESMFHRTSDASKAAVCALVAILRRIGGCLLDIQESSEHLMAMGAVEVSRSDYLVTLSEAVDADCCWPSVSQEPVAYSDLL